MYKTIYLPSNYLVSYLPNYISDLFSTELVTKVKPNIEVHPQLSYNGHSSSGWCWFTAAPKGQVVQLTVTTPCQNVGLYENYLFHTNVVFFGWKSILEKIIILCLDFSF
jgi:hypothetical protein